MRPITHRRLLGAATLAMLVLAGSGCGPSSGGTGTGAALASFNATAGNVCAAEFGALIGCAGGSAITNPGDLGPGTTMTLFADLASGGNVAVTFQAHSVQLRARCQRLAFEGDWGIAASNDARFFGSYVIESNGQQVPASISVQTVAGGELQLVLREADGRVVLGPVRVQRVPAPVAPGAC